MPRIHNNPLINKGINAMHPMVWEYKVLIAPVDGHKRAEKEIAALAGDIPADF